MEAYSPKDIIGESAIIGLLKDSKLWIDCVNARNLSVHDYFSLPESGIVELATRFLKSTNKTFTI